MYIRNGIFIVNYVNNLHFPCQSYVFPNPILEGEL